MLGEQLARAVEETRLLDHWLEKNAADQPLSELEKEAIWQWFARGAEKAVGRAAGRAVERAALPGINALRGHLANLPNMGSFAHLGPEAQAMARTFATKAKTMSIPELSSALQGAPEIVSILGQIPPKGMAGNIFHGLSPEKIAPWRTGVANLLRGKTPVNPATRVLHSPGARGAAPAVPGGGTVAAPPGVTPPVTPGVTPPVTPGVTPPVTPGVTPPVTPGAAAPGAINWQQLGGQIKGYGQQAGKWIQANPFAALGIGGVGAYALGSRRRNQPASFVNMG